jgi:Na+-driven multidrug efflux pump
MHSRAWHSILIVALVAAALLVFAVPADAQCSMCRAALNGSNNARFIRNLNVGVLVLLIPPVTIFCSIFVLLKKYRGTDG